MTKPLTENVIYAINNFKFTDAALRNIEETDTDVRQDLHRAVDGRVNFSSLLEVCLDGAHEGRTQGWRDYCREVFRVMEALPKPLWRAMSDVTCTSCERSLRAYEQIRGLSAGPRALESIVWWASSRTDAPPGLAEFDRVGAACGDCCRTGSAYGDADESSVHFINVSALVRSHAFPAYLEITQKQTFTPGALKRLQAILLALRGWPTELA